MAMPKKRMSHVRSGTRRSQIHLKLASVVYCPQCHSPRRSHTVCLVCGTYRGRKVTSVVEEVKKSPEPEAESTPPK